jgi:transcriptional regulator with XRE-family HTH domain
VTDTPPKRIPEITLQHRLRIARESAGLDQGQLADAISISRNTVTNAECGRNSPRTITLNAWAAATGVSIDWLINGAEAISA